MIYPSIIVQTPVGPIETIPQGRTRLYAKSLENADRPLELHRVPYQVEIHLKKTAAGWEDPRDGSGISLHRISADFREALRDPSPAAYKTVRETIMPAIARWAARNPKPFELAEALGLAEQVQRQEREVQEAEEALAEARTQLATLRGALTALQAQLNLDVVQYATALAGRL